jgi:hypothetical protein
MDVSSAHQRRVPMFMPRWVTGSSSAGLRGFQARPSRRTALVAMAVRTNHLESTLAREAITV